jgi:PAP2 superfamily
MRDEVGTGVGPVSASAPPDVPARGQFRFAVMVALGMSVATLVVAWIYDLPVRDPDSVAGPTWLRLPLILLAAVLLDVVPRAVARAWQRRDLRHVAGAMREVVRERWGLPHLRFALVGLGAWYLTYASFRNLKSFVPFVNLHLWDGTLAEVDRVLFLGHDPVTLTHALFGTGFAAQFFSFLYIAWIVFVPASLVVALVWSRNSVAGAWYVTAVAVDWVLGAVTYFLVPSLGPIYARPELFADLPRTDVTGLQEMMMQERSEVLVNPFTTHAVQTIAAFASLHVGICVTMCVMAELLRLHWGVRAFLWVFLALTVPCTVYLGWHYAVDAIGGAALGVAGVWIAGKGTGNAFRRRPLEGQAVTAGGSMAARSRAA